MNEEDYLRRANDMLDDVVCNATWLGNCHGILVVCSMIATSAASVLSTSPSWNFLIPAVVSLGASFKTIVDFLHLRGRLASANHAAVQIEDAVQLYTVTDKHKVDL